jgi:hypothetical protein
VLQGHYASNRRRALPEGHVWPMTVRPALPHGVARRADLAQRPRHSRGAPAQCTPAGATTRSRPTPTVPLSPGSERQLGQAADARLESRDAINADLKLLLLAVAEAVPDDDTRVCDKPADLCDWYNRRASTRAREVTAGGFPYGRPGELHPGGAGIPLVTVAEVLLGNALLRLHRAPMCAIRTCGCRPNRGPGRFPSGRTAPAAMGRRVTGPSKGCGSTARATEQVSTRRPRRPSYSPLARRMRAALGASPSGSSGFPAVRAFGGLSAPAPGCPWQSQSRSWRWSRRCRLTPVRGAAVR